MNDNLQKNDFKDFDLTQEICKLPRKYVGNIYQEIDRWIYCLAT